MNADWTLYVADRAGTRQAQIDTYESAEVVARVNDISSWTLSLPSDTEAGRIFATDTFARLEVAYRDETWRSGPVTQIERTVDLDGDMLDIAGADDTIWLARRLAHPQPSAAAPPYSTTAYDTHTGPVSTVLAELVNVNAGPGAVAARRVAGLTVPTPAPAGPAVTVDARWQNLLTRLQDTARPSGMLFDIVDLVFHAWLPVDSGAVFSEGLETLAGWTLTAPAPTANKAVVAGGGQLTARVVREATHATSVASWGLVEAFVDQRQTTDTAALDQAAGEALAAGVAPVSVEFVPLDTEGQQFGRDWQLGDLVTVVAGTLTVHDQIRQVAVKLGADDVTIVPSVGTPTGDLRLFRSLAGLDRRVRQLERV